MTSAWKGPAVRFGGIAVLLSLLLMSASAFAQDFYAGKQLNMLVGSATGGGYDQEGERQACAQVQSESMKLDHCEPLSDKQPKTLS